MGLPFQRNSADEFMGGNEAGMETTTDDAAGPGDLRPPPPPVLADDGGGGEPRKRRSIAGFIADKAFPLLTAFLTALTAFLGVVSVSATSENGDLEDTVASLRRQTDVLEEENATLTDEVDTVTADRDQWREQAESAPTPDDDLGSTTTTTTSGSGTGSSAPGDPGVFRETGDTPITFGRGYGIDLDSRASDWEVSGGGDVSFSYSSSFDSNQMSMIDHEPTYADCDAQTLFTPYLSDEQVVVGKQMCVTTSDGRLAHVRIAAVGVDLETISLDVTVWELPNE